MAAHDPAHDGTGGRSRSPCPGEGRPPLQADAAWDENALFDYIKQSYLLSARWMQSTVGEVEGLDGKTAKKVDFYTRQFVDAMAPSNFVMTNPEVLRKTIESGGENLVKGLDNLLEDLERGKGKLSIKMTDTEAFTVGENIATTPGKVVYPERSDAVDPVQRRPPRRSTRRPLADHAALDQQVLHPGPAGQEQLHQMGRRSRG